MDYCRAIQEIIKENLTALKKITCKISHDCVLLEEEPVASIDFSILSVINPYVVSVKITYIFGKTVQRLDT